MPGVRGRLGKAAAAFSSNARNPSLRRAQLSFLGAWTAEWAFTVGLGIVAYRDGGATAVGLVGLLRMAPSAVLAPLLSPLADRGRRERVLVLVSTLRGLATGAAAVVVGVSGPTEVVYALAVLSTIAATLYRPAHSALLPSLCHSGYELASANVVRGLLDSVATLVGPLLAALLLQLRRRDRGVRGGRGCIVLGRGPAVAAALRSTAATGRPQGEPAALGSARESGRSAETPTWLSSWPSRWRRP